MITFLKIAREVSSKYHKIGRSIIKHGKHHTKQAKQHTKQAKYRTNASIMSTYVVTRTHVHG